MVNWKHNGGESQTRLYDGRISSLCTKQRRQAGTFMHFIREFRFSRGQCCQHLIKGDIRLNPVERAASILWLGSWVYPWAGMEVVQNRKISVALSLRQLSYLSIRNYTVTTIKHCLLNQVTFYSLKNKNIHQLFARCVQILSNWPASNILQVKLLFHEIFKLVLAK